MVEQTPDLSASLIALITSAATLLGLVAAWVKQKMAVDKINADRAATKIERNNDSEKLHDEILKHGFMITQLKDQQALVSTVVDDLRDSMSSLNVNIAKLSITVETLNETVKEMKK